jgi:hypothetical protein
VCHVKGKALGGEGRGAKAVPLLGPSRTPMAGNAQPRGPYPRALPSVMPS